MTRLRAISAATFGVMGNQPQDPSGRHEVRWTQPFGWGLLLAFDDEIDGELPDELGSAAVVASSSCLLCVTSTTPVRGRSGPAT